MQPEPICSESQFDDYIAQLERAVLAPVVPGELLGWARNVQQTAARLGRCLQEYVPRVLHEQYRLIAKENPDLLRRVELLRAEDVRLLEEFQAFQKLANELVLHAEAAKYDEHKAAGLQAGLERQGTALVIGLMKHQVAVSTWRTESLDRDTGFAD